MISLIQVCPLLAALLLLPAAASSSSATPADPLATAALLRAHAIDGASPAWDLVESLTTDIGPRPVGSPAMERARDWALERLKALGFRNVHAEPFIKEHAWMRGAESGSVVAPVSRPLTLIGLGGSVPTPIGGIEAEVVVFRSLAELRAAPPKSLTGHIALVNQPMTRTQDINGYLAATRARTDGPSIAAARGAVAYLTRSIATGMSRTPHTGATFYAKDQPRIPAAALGIADANLLDRLAARGTPGRVHLTLASHEIAAAPAWNVVGEIPGTEQAAGSIVIGAHLDSWDPGEGAIDDGAGVAITIAAARLVAELPVRPRHTIRVVAFGSEETTGSGDAYAAAHAGERDHIALVGESDLGSGRVVALALQKGLAGSVVEQQLAIALAPLGIIVRPDRPTDPGTDVEPLVVSGIPAVELQQDVTHYFDVHHSADDTLDKVNRADLEQNVAAWAILLYLVDRSDVVPR